MNDAQAKSHTVPAPTSVDMADQIAALLESTALLQRTAAQLLSQMMPQGAGTHHYNQPYAPPEHSVLNLSAPASAQASILGPGVPIPSRGWQMDHSPRGKIIAGTKARLMKDGWPDCDDTDEHATRLSEAMLRLGMEDMDNFATEASRLNCSNMAISATLVSAVVATFVANTYNDHESQHMRIVNGLWLLSLFLSLATATLCMLVSEWLTWSTSQELRDLSFLYLLVRTAFRSLLMHTSIFLFFAGLMVLMWNESTFSVCIVPTLACVVFVVYYIIATLRAPFLAFFKDVRQFDDHDFRGLRVQIWTPFTLTSHHLFNYFFVIVVDPLKRLARHRAQPKSSDHEGSSQPPPHTTTSEFIAKEKVTSHQGAIETPLAYRPAELHSSPTPINRPHIEIPISQRRGRSPLGAPANDRTRFESPHSLSRAGTPSSIAPAEVMDLEEAEFKNKLRTTRLRRLTDHEFLSPGRGPRSAHV
ncbi:hypothetical protein BDV93DRAFT_525040 [Ceratobasidium sp. AG-I]|nr:hypothetical protein BDV93DRAFT_525040 [Ceratobasidium sp. AG-I]